MRPIGCLSELQSARTGAVGERLDAPVIEVAAAIEHDALDTGLERPACDLATDSGRKIGLRTGHAVEGLRRRRGERAARVVVDDLGVDPAVRPVHGEPRARGRPRHTSTYSTVTALTRLLSGQLHLVLLPYLSSTPACRPCAGRPRPDTGCPCPCRARADADDESLPRPGRRLACRCRARRPGAA